MAYSTIVKPSDYFNTVTYSGTGSAQSITGVGFRPDWLWIKHREDVSNHKLQDVVRGSTKVIGSNETSAEATVAQGVTSFDSDGFSLGTDVSVNGTGAAGIVAWNWLASNTTASNTDGSITSTVSANQTAGFSIVKWTGNATSSQSVGHGLGAVPKVILTKNTDNGSQPWKCYFEAVGNAKYLQLNTTDVPATSGVWSNTTPTSSIISISNDTGINGSGNDIIAYCFAEKKGYSKFGSYTGNGNANGTFIYTGFAPSFVIMKRTDNTGAWYTLDNKRPTYNPKDKYLSPNSSNAESTFTFWDFLSNGFKIRNTGTENNASGGSYIYMAFAEEPLVANVGASIPATAR